MALAAPRGLDVTGTFERLREAYFRYYDTPFGLSDARLQTERRELFDRDNGVYRRPLIELRPEYVTAPRTLTDSVAACHGPDGKGNPALGAPNLTDHIWLHGGTLEDIEHSIGGGRQGAMPAGSTRLTSDQIRVLAAYVYHLSHQGDAAASQGHAQR